MDLAWLMSMARLDMFGFHGDVVLVPEQQMMNVV